LLKRQAKMGIAEPHIIFLSVVEVLMGCFMIWNNKANKHWGDDAGISGILWGSAQVLYGHFTILSCLRRSKDGMSSVFMFKIGLAIVAIIYAIFVNTNGKRRKSFPLFLTLLLYAFLCLPMLFFIQSYRKNMRGKVGKEKIKFATEQEANFMPGGSHQQGMYSQQQYNAPGYGMY